METEYQSTFDSEGNSQPNPYKKIPTPHRGYSLLKGDVVSRLPTSNDMHGMDLWLGQIWVLWRLSVQIVTERPKKIPLGGGWPFGEYSRRSFKALEGGQKSWAEGPRGGPPKNLLGRDFFQTKGGESPHRFFGGGRGSHTLRGAGGKSPFFPKGPKIWAGKIFLWGALPLRGENFHVGSPSQVCGTKRGEISPKRGGFSWAHKRGDPI